MRRTEVLEGVRLMKFRDVFGRCARRELSKLEAAELFGVSGGRSGDGVGASKPKARPVFTIVG